MLRCSRRLLAVRPRPVLRTAVLLRHTSSSSRDGLSDWGVPSSKHDPLLPEHPIPPPPPLAQVSAVSKLAHAREALEDVLAQLNTEEAARVVTAFEPREMATFQDLIFQVQDEKQTEKSIAYLLYLVNDIFARHGFHINLDLQRPPDPKNPYVPPDVLEQEEDEVELLSAQDMSDDTSFPRFPNLLTHDPLMDSHESITFPATPGNPFENKVTVRNHYPMFHELLERDGRRVGDPEGLPRTVSDLTEEEFTLPESTGFRPSYNFADLHIFPLIHRVVKQQTSKGKIMRHQIFVIVGDGNGMVGLGSGKDENPQRASDKAKIKAYKNMDFVERFEDRTIWTEMDTKFGATRIIMRPRPMGFGLRCAPILHQVLKAAGIKDISAKIWGSRHPIVCMYATLRMLQGGHGPLGMGDGLGGPGRRLNKGIGMKTKTDIERDRGRKLINLRN